MADGSEPCPRPRDERFAHLVAVDGLTYLAAWVESAESFPKPEPTNGARVQASRMAKRTADRRAFLAKTLAEARASEERIIDTSPKAIQGLMDEVSASLRQAAEIAKAHGLRKLADSIRSTLAQHVSRGAKMARRGDRDCRSKEVGEKAMAMARRYLEL
ncbi:MAG: hypothetical protein VX874_11600 [Pseudomonadota bacterium]|nr:hypothetical protein [Pseudomonadota bacterium]